jgi:hypothetical protein
MNASNRRGGLGDRSWNGSDCTGSPRTPAWTFWGSASGQIPSIARKQSSVRSVFGDGVHQERMGAGQSMALLLTPLFCAECPRSSGLALLLSKQSRRCGQPSIRLSPMRVADRPLLHRKWRASMGFEPTISPHALHPTALAS